MPSPQVDRATPSEPFTAIFEPDEARALRRYLDWSHGEGFKLAIVSVSLPRERNRLSELIQADYPDARIVPLDEAPLGGIRNWLVGKLNEDPSPGLLVLTRFEERADRSKLAAALNIERDELARAIPVPWVFVVHRAAARELEQHAPDFCDFAAAWVSGKETWAEPAPNILDTGVVSPLLLASQATADPLLSKALRASDRGDQAAVVDALAAYELARPADDEKNVFPDLLAGVFALTRLDWQAARDAFKNAIASASEEVPAIVAFAQYGDAIGRLMQGDFSGAITQLQEEVLPAWAGLGAPPLYVQAVSFLIELQVLQSKIDEARHIAHTELLPFLENPPDQPAEIALSAAAALIRAQCWTEAEQIINTRIIPTLDDNSPKVLEALMLLATIREATGDIDAEEHLLTVEVLPRARTIDNPRLLFTALGRVASLLERRGLLAESLRMRREEQLPIADAANNDIFRITTFSAIGRLLTKLERYQEATSMLTSEGLPCALRIGSPMIIGVTASELATALALAGQPERALSTWRDVALPAFHTVNATLEVAQTLLLVAFYLHALGRSDEAILCLRDKALPAADLLPDPAPSALGRILLRNFAIERGKDIDHVLIERVDRELRELLERLEPQKADELRAMVRRSEQS